MANYGFCDSLLKTMGEQHHHPKLENSATDLGAVRGGERSRLRWVLVLTLLVMVGEFVGGLFA